MKTKVDAEIIEQFGTVTVKVYVPTAPFCSCDKYYFTKYTKREAIKAARNFLSDTNYSLGFV